MLSRKVYETQEYYEVSIVVVTYNPILEKLLKTLESILIQEDVTFQVVIADDGSKNNLFEEIQQFFKEKQFLDYKLISNCSNKGTVLNTLSGTEQSEGKYVKIISPGDYLYDKYVLSSWIDYLKEKQAPWSFSEALYYRNEKDEFQIISAEAYPNDIKPYLKSREKKCRWNYVVLNDIALGATMICERELQLTYLRKIANKVIYAEDHIWRLLMLDGYVGCYYPELTVLYEYGTGISTQNSDIWSDRLMRDWKNADEIMLYDDEKEKKDDLKIKMIKTKQMQKHVHNVFIKGGIRDWLLKKFYRRMTMTEIHKKCIYNNVEDH